MNPDIPWDKLGVMISVDYFCLFFKVTFGIDLKLFHLDPCLVIVSYLTVVSLKDSFGYVFSLTDMVIPLLLLLKFRIFINALLTRFWYRTTQIMAPLS